MSTNQLRPRPEPLPEKTEDWERKIKSGLTLNDHVEVAHLALWNSNDQYRAYHEAVWDSDALEGSISIDATMAAQMLRGYAKEKLAGNPAGEKNLDTIKKSLGVVLRRYGNSRKERRHTVAGQVVPGDNDVD
jgi:hypothetical protein